MTDDRAREERIDPCAREERIDPCHDVLIVGAPDAEQRLTQAGIAGIAVYDDCDLSQASFDEATHTWVLPTCRARIVVTNQIRSGRDNLKPYLGVATHGVPNYFMVTGADAVAAARLNYIAECLKLLRRTESTRIEVLYSTQRMVHVRKSSSERTDPKYWQRMHKLAPAAFDLSSHIGVESDLYDGRAVIRVGDDEREVRVRLSGRLDPLDGRYHWQGTIFDELSDDALGQPATVAIGERSAEGRITERTPQGRFSVAGVGAPPYPLDDVEVVVPNR
ncbi:DUF4873 domain-containing protein [Mycolicibacterium agri]|nr:DUF4873 domain-containing protein [Mycolicibacterium agri]GFG55763.1 hypothetical protein MAGR_72040 [Mycolicibacterium agri]